MKAELRATNKTSQSLLPALPKFTTASAVAGGGGGSCLTSLDAGCLEKLLLHCANALDRNDITLAQQVMWVLNNVASPSGDLNQRLASYFLRALVSKLCPAATTAGGDGDVGTTTWRRRRRLMSVTELAGYVDLIPWHRFGFSISNGAILRAIQGFPKLHVLDFSITHCMQWPTLIDALGKLPEGPPSLRISVVSWRPPVPPLLSATVEEIGQRLANFARFRDVPFEFSVIDAGGDESHECSSHDFLLTQLNPSRLELRDDEALVVNCQNWLRYLPDEKTMTACNEVKPSCRDSFLHAIKTLNPRIVTVVDEDCDLGASTGLASRITACFNYMWIPFDALENFLPKNSPQRMEYESDIGHKIENIIGSEGSRRIERLESGAKLTQRMVNKGFVSIPFHDETIKEVKVLLEEHSSGWGMKKDEDMVVLTWKGHSSVYASVWAPNTTGVEPWQNSTSN